MKQASKDFTEAQRIKRVGSGLGNHEHSGHRADFYWLTENKVLKIYVEESRQRKDWKDNFDMFHKEFSNVTGAYYHRGFYRNAVIALYKINAIKETYNEIEFYSYSQGSAVAQIVSDIMTHKGSEVITRFVTFGCPNNVKKNRYIKDHLRRNHTHYVQGWDVVFYGIFWLKKYGNIVKLKGRGTPFHSHSYYHLNKN